MKISKKKIRQVSMISVYEKILADCGFNCDFSCSPENWSDEEKKLFDLVTQIEDSLKKEIMSCLSEENSSFT